MQYCVNVNGKIMEFEAETVEMIEETALGVLLSGRHEVEMKDNVLFIDRDVQVFSYLKEFLETGVIPEISKKDQWLLKKEFEHWVIPWKFIQLQKGVFNKKPLELEDQALQNWISVKPLAMSE